VFKSKKPVDRDFVVPSKVEADAKAREVLRAWVANGGLVCALRPETWPDPSNWGIVLADVNGDDPAATAEKIRALYNAELANPSDKPTGHF